MISINYNEICVEDSIFNQLQQTYLQISGNVTYTIIYIKQRFEDLKSYTDKLCTYKHGSIHSILGNLDHNPDHGC